MNTEARNSYYVPHVATWPIVGSIALAVMLGGLSALLNEAAIGKWLMIGGALLLFYMMFGWFGEVIGENQKGLYNTQVDRSFRLGMKWFIFSEVMFFGAFFAALFYARALSLPWLGGQGTDFWTNFLLWPGFSNEWPSNGPGDIGGDFQPMGARGIPALNTVILLTSGVTITIAHHGLKAGRRGVLALFLMLTFLLGYVFVGLQAYEYLHAWEELNLTLGSGIYGTTFYMLTGFHGLHVTIGAIMLTVIWLRCLKGHFTPEQHFAFEGVAWYWHFVDVVWLGLFIFVYLL